MKASASVRSGRLAFPHERRNITLLAGTCLAAHLALSAPSLEDIDSINFALGLRRFSIADHQPHPPGYPVYVGLGRVSRTVVGAVAPTMAPVRADALALAFWSALGGAVALLAAGVVFRAMAVGGGGAGAAFWAAVLLTVAPVSWLSAQRPMSDTVGFAAALVAQALVLTGRGSPPRLVAGAVAAGLAAGVRTQTALLTLPLLCFALVEQRRRGTWWLVSRPLAGLAAGGLVWAIPLLVLSGGVSGYLDALGSQAGEDFAFVEMLWADPTPRRIALALRDTLVLPWAEPALAGAVAVAAAVGVGVLVGRERRSLALLLAAFGPYALFHLLFQETAHVRYAIPVLGLVVWPAARGLATLGRLSPVAASGLACWALWVVLPASLAYGRDRHPAFRAIDDMRQAAPAEAPAAVHAHFPLRRPLQAASPHGLPVIEPRRRLEWLGLVDYWRRGGTGRVWFLADPRRSDLELIDPLSRRNVVAYRWSVADRAELGGTRPLGVDWYRLDRPGWVAAEGWSLTPETGGIAAAGGTGVDRRPITALVRRRPGPVHLVIGGAVLATHNPRVVLFELSLEGAVVDRWRFDPAREGPTFLRFIDLPSGIPGAVSAGYATLTVAARAEAEGEAVFPVAIRQFDLQSSDTLIYAFGEGWHEYEYDNASGLRWRWTSQQSVLRVAPPRGVAISLAGESPLRYFDAAPTVRISAGGRTLAELRPEADFDWRVRVPRDAVAAGGGAIVVDVDRGYRPSEAEGSADRRTLGLRLFRIGVDPAEP
jgi:hypothetical protein